jgi:hypothetical protein
MSFRRANVLETTFPKRQILGNGPGKGSKKIAQIPPAGVRQNSSDGDTTPVSGPKRRWCARTPRRFAHTESLRKSARSWSARAAAPLSPASHPFIYEFIYNSDGLPHGDKPLEEFCLTPSAGAPGAGPERISDARVPIHFLLCASPLSPSPLHTFKEQAPGRHTHSIIPYFGGNANRKN